jgi:hypothetical protein
LVLRGGKEEIVWGVIVWANHIDWFFNTSSTKTGKTNESIIKKIYLEKRRKKW